MYLKEMELDNFKSFKHQRFLFNQSITAITGPNGSGKSNIFDAILFVLGNNSSLKLRYKKISDLINKDQKEKIANVKLTFSDGTILERFVSEDSSIFRLNGKRTTQESIISFLKELKISSEGHNFVQQGNNKRIVDMTGIERKKLFEDIAGVSLFDEQKEKSNKNLEFVKTKITQAKTILNERKIILDNLTQEREIALEYIDVKNKEIIYKAILLKKEKLSLEKEIQRNTSKVELLNSKIPEMEGDLDKLYLKINENKSRLNKLNEDLDTKTKEFNEIDSDCRIFEYKINDTITNINNFKNELIKINDKIDKLKQNINNIDSVLENITELRLKSKNLKKELESYDANKIDEINKKIKEENKKIDLKIQEIYSKVYELTSQKDNYEKNIELKKNDLIMVSDYEKEIVSFKEKILDVEEYELTIKKYKDEKYNLEVNIENDVQKVDQIKEKIFDLNSKIDKNNNKIDSLKQAKKEISDLIVINDDLEIDKILTDFESKNIYGKFFFVFRSNEKDVKSKIIIKEIDSELKIKELISQNEKYNDSLIDFNEELKTKEISFKTNSKLLQDLDIELFDVQAKKENVVKNNYVLQNKINILENEIKNIKSKVYSLNNVDDINSKLSNFELEINSLKSKKIEYNSDFENYKDLTKNYHEVLENLQSKEKEYNDMMLNNNLNKKEIENYQNNCIEIQNKINDFNQKHDKLNIEFENLNKKRLNIKNELNLILNDREKLNLIINTDLENKNNLNTNISLSKNELNDIIKNLFIKEEELVKKIEEIKKYISINQNVDVNSLEEKNLELQKKSFKDLETEYYNLLEQLNNFGNVNLKSIEDYKEYLEKYNVINERVFALESESEEIKSKIKEIQMQKEAKFMTCFTNINNKFKEILQKLNLNDLEFGLVKNEEEILEVLLNAKNKRTISLSGGEKALVTISFLLSNLLLEPSSFYLLDEIDADLDYNNSEKVYDMLNDYAKDSQIFMVTHNPVVVNKANNVIGVSKNTKGITTVFIKQENQ